MSGPLSSSEGHLGNLLKAWQAYRDTSQGEAGDPVSHSSSNSDIMIPINFQEESEVLLF